MRILFNGASAIRPKTGVGHTTMNLHRALSNLSPSDEFWCYPGERIRGLAGRFFKPAAHPRPSVRPPKPARSGLANRIALHAARNAYGIHFNTIARLGGFDLYHEPNLVPFRVPLPTVVTVHDLSVLLFPNWHPADRVKRYEQAFARGIEAAAHILVDSDAVRSEAIRVLGLSPERVTTVHCGIAPAFQPQPPEAIAAVRSRLDLPVRYLLCVGTVEPRKNLTTLLRAFCDLPAALRESCPLVLGGSWGWRSEPERELFESEARHKCVRYLGYVADEDLPGLYAGAEALFYPSHYEGFGLPPIEMMATGGRGRGLDRRRGPGGGGQAGDPDRAGRPRWLARGLAPHDRRSGLSGRFPRSRYGPRRPVQLERGGAVNTCRLSSRAGPEAGIHFITSRRVAHKQPTPH